MASKLSHADVNYRDGSATRNCGSCSMFRKPASCTDVVEPIRASGLCDIFDRKKERKRAGARQKARGMISEKQAKRHGV